MDTSVTYTADSVQDITISGSSEGYKPRFVRILSGFGTGVVYGVHNPSLVNLMRGVVERVLYISTPQGLQRCPKPRPGAFDKISRFGTRLLTNLSPTPVVARADYSALYSGRKRDNYEKAYESLVRTPIRKKDSYVSTFVKAEKVNFTAKSDPAPRVIQPRSPRYNLEVGRYLKLFEKEIVRGFRRMFGYQVILKGLNAEGVAQCLHNNWLSYSDPIAVGLDASRFDQHVSTDALEYEHSIYNSVFRSKELRQLLSWQLRNKGFGRVGEQCLKYQVDGCRMSGDINTGMGNCLLMSSMVMVYLEEIGCKAHLSNNGDDCVLILERRDFSRLEGLGEWFLDLGFNMKIEDPVDVFERIEFCQAQPVLVGDQYRMVRNPFTAPSKDCVSLLSWDKLADFETWRSAIGICGLELTRGVPYWQAFYTRLQGDLNRVGGVERIYECGMGSMAAGVTAVGEITPEARYSFYLAFGLLPDAQIALEQQVPTISYTQEMPLIELATSSLLNFNNLCLRNKPNACAVPRTL